MEGKELQLIYESCYGRECLEFKQVGKGNALLTPSLGARLSSHAQMSVLTGQHKPPQQPSGSSLRHPTMVRTAPPDPRRKANQIWEYGL